MTELRKTVLTDLTDDLEINADGSINIRLGDGTTDVGVNTDGSLQSALRTKVCTNNETDTPLGAGGVFTGTPGDTFGYASVLVTVFTDVASAVDGLSIQFSKSDAPVDWHESDAYTIAAGAYKTFTFQPVDRFFRIVYTNGAAPQTTFHISVKFHSVAPKASSHRMGDDISGEDDATLQKSIIAAERPGTAGVYTNVQATNSGNLKVSVEELDGALLTTDDDDDTDIDGLDSVRAVASLYARIDADTVKPVRMDGSTHSLQIIDYDHHEIHSGSHYFISGYADLAINHVLQFTWQMPNTAKWTHWVWKIFTEAETLWQVYEGGTITNPLANALTPLNNNRNSLNVSGTTMRYEDHANLAGANGDVDISGALLIESGIAGAGKDAGFSDRGSELVLKQNELYVLRATATAAGYVNFYMEWYEHTDKD